MRTRAFKSGNSQAVRIPAEIAFTDMSTELEITRTGDVLTVRPVNANLKDAIELLRQMPKPESVVEIERTETRHTLDD